MEQHARLGPSNHRWPHCPGSVREEAAYHDTAGDAAIDGTGTHLLLEMCLLNNVNTDHYDQMIIGTNNVDRPQGWLIDKERCERAQIALDYVVRRKKELQKQFHGCKVYVQAESKSNPGFYAQRNDWWGTCDITITVVSAAPIGELLFVEVVDYKDGRMFVSEKWNSQLIAYLFGKMIEVPEGVRMDVPDVGMRMTIIQPKTNTPIRYMCSTNPDHGLTKITLMAKVNWLIKCAEATDDPEAPLISGKHCQWCKHNPKRGGTCTADTEKSMEVINTMTTDIVVSGDDGLFEIIKTAVSDVKSMSEEQLTKIADAEAGFQASFDKVRAEIKERIESGVPVSGYAMLPGNKKKTWNEDEETIAKKLKARRMKKDEIYPAKLITPAAALKHPSLTPSQRKKLEKDLISVVDGKLTLKKVEYQKEIKDANKMFMDVGVIKEELVEPVTKEISFF